MKKLLLSASMLLTAGFAFAQVSNSSAPAKPSELKLRSTPLPTVVNKDKAPESSARAKKAIVQDWYTPLNFVTEFQGASSPIGSVITSSISFLNTDSNLKWITSDGEIARASFYSVGQVLDPKDDLIDNTENPGIKLSNFNPYKLDSINFTYSYARFTDSTDNDGDMINEEVIDTIFVAYYANANIAKNSFTSGNKDKVAIIDWDINKLIPKNIFKLDTFLLGNDRTNSPFDTTSVNADKTRFGLKNGTLAAPAGINIAAGNLVGFTVTYKSGVKTVVNGDTAVFLNQGTTTPNRLANAFGLSIFRNPESGGQVYTNPTYYNTSEFQIPLNAVGQWSPGWSGNYLSGHVIFIDDLFLPASFHLTSLNVGVAENDLVSISSVYPNPANGSTNVSFNLKQAGNVAVSITNLLGQTVATVNPGKMAAGSNNVSLNLSNIKAGVYFVNVSVDGVNTTKKLTVTE
jgi:hypothetical protein